MTEVIVSKASAQQVYVGRAAVVGRPVAFKDMGIANVNDTYRGQVLTTEGVVENGIIKDLSLRELANEVMAAALAHALALDIPKAYLAFATDNELRAKKAPRIRDGSLLFVSVDVEKPSMAHVATGASPTMVAQLLARLIGDGDVGRCYGFDAWAANTDRHIGNLLFDGKGRPWLIDHGWCFTGPQWKSSDLDPALVYRNRLKEWLTPEMSSEQRQRSLSVAHQLIEAMASLDVLGIGRSNMVEALIGVGDFDGLTNFLVQRVGHAVRLTADALDIQLVM